MNKCHSILTLIILCFAANTIASPRSDLASPSQATRDAAASILLRIYNPPSRTTWEPLVAALSTGMPKSNVLQTVKRFCPESEPEIGISSGDSSEVSYRLDDLWMLECSFKNTSRTLIECHLSERLQHVWVEPPSGFSGTWITYYVNGRINHEIHYKNGKYQGEFIVFRPDGSKWYVQQYDAQNAEGEDIGYFPSGHIKYRGVYKKGKPVGIWKWYNEDETVRTTKNYDTGK